jgi:hypothetical protein
MTGAAMNAETDYELTPEQWEVLKALRAPASLYSAVNRSTLAGLIALDLAAVCEDLPVLTPIGRKVLVRGSPGLWDVAA